MGEHRCCLLLRPVHDGSVTVDKSPYTDSMQRWAEKVVSKDEPEWMTRELMNGLCCNPDTTGLCMVWEAE